MDNHGYEYSRFAGYVKVLPTFDGDTPNRLRPVGKLTLPQVPRIEETGLNHVTSCAAPRDVQGPPELQEMLERCLNLQVAVEKVSLAQYYSSLHF